MKGNTKQFKSVLLAALTSCLMLIYALPANAGEMAVLDNNRLSLDAVNVPLPELLVEIGNTTGIDIYLSDMVKPAMMTLKIDNLPLEESFKRILKEYSYAAVFTGSENNWKITTIKIFPKGQQEGKLVSLVANGQQKTTDKQAVRTVFVTDGHETPVLSAPPKRGMVAPARAMNTLPNDATTENAPWLVLQQQFAREQEQVFQEQLFLQQQIEATTDPEKRQALTLVYADKVSEYQAMQAAHTNQIESIKRIYNAREAQEAFSGQKAGGSEQ